MSKSPIPKFYKKILIPDVVMRELDNLKRSNFKFKARLAANTIKKVDHLLGQPRVSLLAFFQDKKVSKLYQIHVFDNDGLIIAHALEQKRENPAALKCSVCLLTHDKSMQLRAKAAGLKTL